MRGFFAGDAFMAMEVGDARDFDGTLPNTSFTKTPPWLDTLPRPALL